MTRRGRAPVPVRLACALALGPAAVGLTGCGSASTSAGPAAAPTAASTASTAPTPAPSGTSTGHTLVQGTIRGAATDQPATVRLVLWPHDDAEVGDTVDTWESPAVTTDADGRWAIEVDPASLDAAYLSPDEPYVNVDIDVRSGTIGTQWSTSAESVGDTGLWRTVGAGPEGRVIDVVMDLSGEVTVTDSFGESTSSPLTVGSLGPATG